MENYATYEIVKAIVEWSMVTCSVIVLTAFISTTLIVDAIAKVVNALKQIREDDTNDRLDV